MRFTDQNDGRPSTANPRANSSGKGLAISRRDDPDTSRNGTYDRLQSRAEAAGIGLWAPDECGPATADVSVGLDIRYDADGNDNDNKNDEWVRFTNNGSAPLDLDGWIVADESASQRYTFRILGLDVGASVTLFTGCGDHSATERSWFNSGVGNLEQLRRHRLLADPNGNTVLSESYQGD